MIQHNPKATRTLSIQAVVISFITLFFPFTNILPLFFPIQFLGKNAWLVLPIVVIAAMFVISLFTEGKFVVFHTVDLGLLVIAVLGWLIHAARGLAYTESRSILDLRYIISSIIFLLAFKRIVEGAGNLESITWAVLLTCLIQAILGILHAHFFSYININVEDLEFFFDAERTREGGTLGASIYANFIVCGMFLLVARKSNLSSIRYAVFENVAILAMLYAITLSGSRYPMICAFLLTCIFLSKSLSNWRQMAALFGLVAVISYFFLANKEGLEFHSILRFSEDSGGRLDKLLLPLMLLSDRFIHFLIGAPSALIEATFSEDGLGISDNSYMLMSLQFGTVFAICWFTFFIHLLRRNALNRFSFLFMIYVLVGLGLTNGILWEPWVFVAMLVSTIIYHDAPAYRKIPATRVEAAIHLLEEVPQRLF
ncbi:MAG: hypothetical protein HY282_10440 [Nitrospirae bacterium]|nr:hypothetical protein [Candidatus Manganitrophaceae bacterium]